jgi:hypothetical protein
LLIREKFRAQMAEKKINHSHKKAYFHSHKKNLQRALVKIKQKKVLYSAASSLIFSCHLIINLIFDFQKNIMENWELDKIEKHFRPPINRDE